MEVSDCHNSLFLKTSLITFELPSKLVLGIGPGDNLTFWRPQAPSNYAILGDCLTSR